MIRVGLALSLLLAVAPRADAQHPLPVFGDSVVVTATGEPVPSDEAVAATTVIRREEIAASGAADVGELLRRVEGAVLLRSGLDNGVTSFFVRGAGAAQTLVLLDGVRLNSPFFGGYDWSIPLTAGIERVEVVRGPYSALYGADAVGGVVQLFSERGGDDTLRLALEAGPDGWRRGELAANVTSGRWGVRVAGGTRAGSGPLAHDDFTSRVGTADVGYELGSGGRVGMLVRRTATRTDVPFSGATITPNRVTEADETLAAVPLRLPLGATADLEASLAHVERALSFRDPDDPGGFTASDTDADSDEGRVVLRWRPGSHRLTLGGELRRDVVSDGSSFGPNLVAESLLTRSLFAQDEIDLGRDLTLLVGARWDEAGAWGSEVSPRASLSWTTRSLRTWVSAGQAFRAPALGELYYPYAGNPSLEAEHSRSAEAGVVVPLSDGLASTQLVVFANRTEDLIDFDFASFRYVNAGHAEQRGVEGSFTRQLGRGGRARVAATWLDAVGDDGQRLLRRPEWSGSATLGLALARGADGEASLVWVGARPDIDPVSFARVEQPGFVTASLAARVTLVSWLDLRVRVENLADREYEEVRGYPAHGRRILVGLESVLR